MSVIDLVILGIVFEKSQSAYDIQKSVDYYNISRWTKMSIPSIYRKVIQLNEKGYLQSNIVKGDKFADKAVYSITDKGKSYFKELMKNYVQKPIPLLFDFNVVMFYLNKMNKNEALELINELKENIKHYNQTNNEYVDIPVENKLFVQQQKMLYDSLLKWLNDFEKRYKSE